MPCQDECKGLCANHSVAKGKRCEAADRPIALQRNPREDNAPALNQPPRQHFTGA